MQLSVARSQLQPRAGDNYTTLRCVQHPKLVIKNSLDNQVSQLITWGFVFCGGPLYVATLEQESQWNKQAWKLQIHENLKDVCMASMLSAITKKMINKIFINNERILTRSTLAAGTVQDTFTGEAEGGDEEMTGGYFYRSGSIS